MAIALLATAAPSAAKAAGRDQFVVPVPNAGDVTLVRVLIAGRLVEGARLGAFTLRAQSGSVPDGVQVAAVGGVLSPRPGRALANVLVAVAQPSTGDAPDGSRITVLLRGRGVHATLVNQSRETNARFFYGDDADCAAFSEPVRHPNLAMRLGGGPWPLGPRSFVRGALAWSCPTAGPAGDPRFDALMRGALGTGYVTWLTDAAGQVTRVCVYVHDDAATSRVVLTSDGRVILASDPLAFSRDEVALVRIEVGVPSLRLQLQRSAPPGGIYAWDATIAASPQQPPPPEPPALAASAGSCAG